MTQRLGFKQGMDRNFLEKVTVHDGIGEESERQEGDRADGGAVLNGPSLSCHESESEIVSLRLFERVVNQW
jgi:hypothetical protein